MWASYQGLGALMGNALSGFLIDQYSVQQMFFYNAIGLSVICLFTLVYFVRQGKGAAHAYAQ